MLFAVPFTLLLGAFACTLARSASLPVTPRNPTVFSSQIHKDVNISFVSDSGVCETTPGVHQMSGYITVGKNMSMVLTARWMHISSSFDAIYFVTSGSGFLNPASTRKQRPSLYGDDQLLPRSYMNLRHLVGSTVVQDALR